MVAVSPNPVRKSPLLAGGLLQHFRIGSGLILFTFVFFHFLNHALGIWSLDAMETFQIWRTAVTRSVPGTIVLGGALLIHVALNLYRIATRSTWRMPIWEAAQIALGLTIPVLLAYHAAYLRAAYAIEGSETSYFETLPGLWNNAALQQTVLLLIVWTHGCIGLHYWLRLGRNYRRIAPILLGAAVLVPALALAGFTVAARDVIEIVGAEQPAAAEEASDTSAAPKPLTPGDVRTYAVWTAWALLGGLAAVLAVRAAMALGRRRIRITYTSGPSILAPIGPTLLELSRMSGVPHASVCGGRARCSTCRVKVDADPASLPVRTPAETATLARIHADSDVRLACQLRPETSLTVTRLVHPPDEKRPVFAANQEEAGVERTLAVLFLDIRGFTALSEARLPYDTVFLLNRFFGEAGEAVTSAGGWIDKYMGDGMMALFGLSQPAEAACRAALVAAVRIDEGLERLNRELGGEIATPLRIGIGLHVGPLVLGRIGHRASASTTVIGPVVNVASRLESLTKEHGVQLVISRALAEKAGLETGAFPETTVTVRGTSEPIAVLLIAAGRDLAPFLTEGEQRSAA